MAKEGAVSRFAPFRGLAAFNLAVNPRFQQREIPLLVDHLEGSPMVKKMNKREARKALLLRVGIDRGTGGALSPIFPGGAFEYVPIPERKRTRNHRSYATLLGRHGGPLADYLPRKLAQAHPHIDPDFKAATYGDAAPRKCRQIGRLMPHDILVFYCGLAPFPPDDISRLFVIGYLRVKAVHRVSARDLETRRKLQHRFGNTAHFVRRVPDRELVLVEGYRTRSRFFRRALPLGDSRDNLLRDLFPLRYQGSIRRAVGHWVRGKAAMKFLESWLRNGPAMLVEARTRLFLVPSSAVGLTIRRGDLTIVVRNNGVAPGDWILSLAEGGITRIALLARINRLKLVGGRRHACSSLFWHVPQGGPLLSVALASSRSLPSILNRKVGQRTIRSLVSWFSGHYRVGLIQHAELAPGEHQESVEAGAST